MRTTSADDNSERPVRTTNAAALLQSNAADGKCWATAVGRVPRTTRTVDLCSAVQRASLADNYARWGTAPPGALGSAGTVGALEFCTRSVCCVASDASARPVLQLDAPLSCRARGRCWSPTLEVASQEDRQKAVVIRQTDAQQSGLALFPRRTRGAALGMQCLEMNA
mgnify:CR=1 FL=1